MFVCLVSDSLIAEEEVLKVESVVIEGHVIRGLGFVHGPIFRGDPQDLLKYGDGWRWMEMDGDGWR